LDGYRTRKQVSDRHRPRGGEGKVAGIARAFEPPRHSISRLAPDISRIMRRLVARRNF
jgi:hypothetical protein